MIAYFANMMMIKIQLPALNVTLDIHSLIMVNVSSVGQKGLLEAAKTVQVWENVEPA